MCDGLSLLVVVNDRLLVADPAGDSTMWQCGGRSGLWKCHLLNLIALLNSCVTSGDKIGHILPLAVNSPFG